MPQEIPQQKLLTQWRFPAGCHTIQLNIEKDGDFTKSDVDAIIEMMTIIRRQMPDEVMTIPADWVTCEYCGGSGHDGFDRCDPPNPYICGKCDGKGKVSPETAATWAAEDIMERDESDSQNDGALATAPEEPPQMITDVPAVASRPLLEGVEPPENSP